MNQLITAGAKIIKLPRFEDERGSFTVAWSRKNKHRLPNVWHQDNVSVSKVGVVRGLHFQHLKPQGKLVQVLHGSAYDVIVDIRPESPGFGNWEGVLLTPGVQLWVPRGCAHGFQALEDNTVFSYKVDNEYDPSSEHTIIWNDPTLGIEWPLNNVTVSEKDSLGVSWSAVAGILGGHNGGV